jgi:hypothetical protein
MIMKILNKNPTKAADKAIKPVSYVGNMAF